MIIFVNHHSSLQLYCHCQILVFPVILAQGHSFVKSTCPTTRVKSIIDECGMDLSRLQLGLVYSTSIYAHRHQFPPTAFIVSYYRWHHQATCRYVKFYSTLGGIIILALLCTKVHREQDNLFP